MKKYIILVIFASIFTTVFAQQKQFSLDENGKYTYYEVIDAKNISKDSLVQMANSFIDELHKKSYKKESVTDSSITAKGTMIIDKTLLVASHPSGEMSYNFVFEAREGKYRFWFTNFEYIPYQRDRYGNFVATTNIGTPLEKTPGKLGAGEWKDILSAAYQKTSKIAEDFKKNLATSKVVAPVKKKETISTKKW